MGFKGAAQDPARFVQLGLGVATGTFEHAGNFAMIETVYVVEEEDTAIARSHGVDGAFDGQTIDDASLHQVTSTKTAAGALFRDIFHQLIERHNSQRALTKVHEYSIYGHAVEPCGESGVAAKGSNLAVQLKESFLGQVFGERIVSHHAHANCEDAPFMRRVKFRECFVVASLCANHSIGLALRG